MGTKEEKMQMRKRNMKIFPIYKALAWDYLFFYTIDFLFLTQVKNISAANVVLKGSFYSFFCIALQIPANVIIEFLGRKNSLILGNILNCLYMVVLMLSRNLGDLIFAEFLSAVAFSIKDTVQPSLLNESIPPSKYKDKIYSKINSKGASRYYLFNAISKIIAGYLFAINGYLPIACSLFILVFVTILSIMFIEPVKTKRTKIKSDLVTNQIKEIVDGFKFVIKSERLKALLLCGALIATLMTIIDSYYVNIFQDLKVTSFAIGMIAAVGSFISSFASKKQEVFHNKLRNKTLITIAYLLSWSSILAGVYGIVSQRYEYLVSIVVIAHFIQYFCNGIYSTIMDRYLKNFTNKDIDTKVFANKNLFKNSFKVIGGLFGAFLLDRMTTAYCMIIMGGIFTVIYFLVGRYMKTRVGLKPEQYSKEERRYDELKTN